MSTSTTSSSVSTRARNPLTAITRIPFGWQVLIGLVLGIVLGLVAAQMGPVAETEANPDGANWLTTTLDTIGTIFVTLLKALVPPLIFLAIVTSIANLRGVTNAARLAGKTLLWFGITSLIAVSIGIALGVLTTPGANSQVSADAAEASSTQGGWLDFLTGLVPSNFLGITGSASDDGSVSLSFNALQILVISIAVGIAVLKVGEKAEPFLRFTGSALEIVQKLLWWVIRLAPIGTVGLLGNAVASYGWEAIGQLGVFVADVYIGMLIVLLVVYPVLLRANGLSIASFFRGVWPATSLGFVSRSSLGTMPMTQTVTERMGVPRHYASFSVPLGATTKMDGCAAIYPALAAIFVANFYGVPLGVTDYLLIVLVSVLGSAATAGMTGATVMLTLTLSTLGLPLEGVGLLLAIDPILDMGRTALNVTGQSLVPVIVAKREKILDKAAYDASARTSFQAEQKAEADAAERAESDDATAASTEAPEATDAHEAAGTRA
ncbi:dicarboxylate/amino acid:cation symporter [Brachybacterium paraconglomeratum]|uniref:dicarboxylate/amino acid:cation symporter n=1 Tax=Brachybacterium paraconglomeratum TaxID=173362 RepID=UPI0022AF90E7|nr:dicarboxylate/amino acid:cation symporter [Brachybacterium paraconglomeratum]MCZ4326517.1 dicarboxylate/amino acid:cation symporter [Brachybacterium paraconglomeratum]